MPYVRLSRFLLLLKVVSGSVSAMTTGDEQVHRYTAARDHTIQTENYPAAYPSLENYTWEWSAARGHWRLFFLDFQLACAEDPRSEGDLLTVKDDFGSPSEARERKFGCLYRRDHMVQTPQTVKGSRFQLFLSARVPSDQRAKGFRVKVLYGDSIEDVERKVSNLQATAVTITLEKDDGATWWSHVQLVVIVVATVVVAVVVLATTACCVLLLRHRRHNHLHPHDRPHQTTSTSLHLNIGDIRSASSVTYSRHGNGPMPSGSRSRMNSEESTASEVGSLSGHAEGRGRTSGRPVKRSDSSASWAFRAEMASPARLGSTTSSSGSGGGDPHGHRPSLLHPSSDLPPSLSPYSTSTRSAREAAATTESASASTRQNCFFPFPEKGAITSAVDSGSSSDRSVATFRSSKQANLGAGRTKLTPVVLVQDSEESALKLPRGRESSNVADDAEGLVVDDNDNDDDDAVFAEAPKKPQKNKQQVGKDTAKDKDTKKDKKKKHQHKKSQQPAQTATLEAGSRRTARQPSGGTEEEDEEEQEEEGPGIAEDACRLSTISEESRSSASVASKLRVNLPVPAPKLSKGDGSLAVSNCGYILMTGRAMDGPTYVNLSKD